ncbi:MAG TPA: hypothetical protein VN999_04280 [Thermoanaerobaculia bacterium]|nr:hypothetical protein [Thermoanaerobaculia bacterium]
MRALRAMSAMSAMSAASRAHHPPARLQLILLLILLAAPVAGGHGLVRQAVGQGLPGEQPAGQPGTGPTARPAWPAAAPAGAQPAAPAAAAPAARLAGPAARLAAPAAPAPRPAAFPPAPAAPGVEVSVALPAAALTVGDRAEAVITVRVPPTARLAGEPRFPMWRGAWGEAEVREQGEPRRAAGPGGVALYSQRLVLAAFHPGRVELPPAAIALPLGSGTVQAWTPAGLALAVRSVLPAGAAAKDLQLRPAAPLRPLPLGTAFFFTLAVLAAAAAAGIWALWRRERRRRAAAGEEGRTARPLLAPLPELLAALDRLGSEPSPLALHTGISQALRRYLGRAVGFPAPESTTTEIQRVLLARGWPSAHVRPAVDLLRACDLVKFARQQVPAVDARQRLAAARDLGEEIERRATAVEQVRASLEAAG